MPTPRRPDRSRAGRILLRTACCLVLLPGAAPTATSAGSLREMVRNEGRVRWPADRPPFGIAFSVRSRGIMVTAAHVVAGCRAIEVVEPAGPAAASLLLVNQDDDVAILRADADAPLPGRLADRVARPGDRLMRPDFVAPDDRMPPGLEAATVSHLASGLGPAPVLVLDGVFLPGASGSPLLDRGGAVSGMIVGRMGVPSAGIAIRATEMAADLARLVLPPEPPRPRNPDMDFVRMVRCRHPNG